MKKVCPTCKQEVKDKSVNADVKKVILVYKMASGFEKDDKAWDKVFFGRYYRAAKELMEFLGDWRSAADCIQDTVERIKEWNDDATITLDTILKNHSAEWKKNNQERRQHGIHTMPSNGDLAALTRGLLKTSV